MEADHLGPKLGPESPRRDRGGPVMTGVGGGPSPTTTGPSSSWPRKMPGPTPPFAPVTRCHPRDRRHAR